MDLQLRSSWPELLHDISRMLNPIHEELFPRFPVENATALGSLAEELCRAVIYQGRRVRALNPFSPEDTKLLDAINRGQFTFAGFRNRDLRNILFPDAQ